MNSPLSRLARRVAAVVVLAAVAWTGAALWPGDGAQAQSPMAVPPCQCSPATAVPGLPMSVAHCVCGGMACVVSEHVAPNKTTTPLMQCVR